MPKPDFQSLPKGTKFYTPTRRLAKVVDIDSDGRVHVEYVNHRTGGRPEEGCFPLKLVKASDICKTNTDVQHTCGKGEAAPEYYFWRERAGYIK